MAIRTITNKYNKCSNQLSVLQFGFPLNATHSVMSRFWLSHANSCLNFIKSIPVRAWHCSALLQFKVMHQFSCSASNFSAWTQPHELAAALNHIPLLSLPLPQVLHPWPPFRCCRALLAPCWQALQCSPSASCHHAQHRHSSSQQQASCTGVIPPHKQQLVLSVIFHTQRARTYFIKACPGGIPSLPQPRSSELYPWPCCQQCSFSTTRNTNGGTGPWFHTHLVFPSPVPPSEAHLGKQHLYFWVSLFWYGHWNKEQ